MTPKTIRVEAETGTGGRDKVQLSWGSETSRAAWTVDRADLPALMHALGQHALTGETIDFPSRER